MVGQVNQFSIDGDIDPLLPMLFILAMDPLQQELNAIARELLNPIGGDLSG
jgi:hypothetical protein